MGLVWVLAGKIDEKIDDVASFGASVAVIAEEDDEGGGEIGWADLGLEIEPEVSELGDVAMDVTNATHHSLFCVVFRSLLAFHLSLC